MLACRGRLLAAGGGSACRRSRRCLCCQVLGQSHPHARQQHLGCQGLQQHRVALWVIKWGGGRGAGLKECLGWLLARAAPRPPGRAAALGLAAECEVEEACSCTKVQLLGCQLAIQAGCTAHSPPTAHPDARAGGRLAAGRQAGDDERLAAVDGPLHLQPGAWTGRQQRLVNRLQAQPQPRLHPQLHAQLLHALC